MTSISTQHSQIVPCHSPILNDKFGEISSPWRPSAVSCTLQFECGTHIICRYISLLVLSLCIVSHHTARMSFRPLVTTYRSYKSQISTIKSFWTGRNKPIWNTKFCYDHSTETKGIDLFCKTDRRWFAHFYVRKNFKKEWNRPTVCPPLSLLVHIIEILVLVFKGRNLGFWKSTLTQAHWLGCLLLPRDTVGKTSISGVHDNCYRRFNPRLLWFFFFFYLPAWIHWEHADWIALCSKPRGRRLERGCTVKTERKRRATSISSSNGKSHRQTASETKENKLPFYWSIISKISGSILTTNAEFW